MSTERRRSPRVATPLDGSWSGASGGSACRIADISWGGCFINTLAEPSKDERTIVTMDLALEFDPLTLRKSKSSEPILGDPPPSGKSG